MNTLHTLQDIKDAYYLELALEHTDRMSLDEYIVKNYIQTYDNELTFIGYERSSDNE